MAWRATSLKAMFCAVSLGAEAMMIALRTRCGWLIVQRRACMPPRLPPITAAHWSMPRRSASRAWASTQSLTATIGKSAPQGLLVAGEGVTNEDGVGFRSVERAVGLVDEVVGRQNAAAAQMQRFAEMGALCGDGANRMSWHAGPKKTKPSWLETRTGRF